MQIRIPSGLEGDEPKPPAVWGSASVVAGLRGTGLEATAPAPLTVLVEVVWIAEKEGGGPCLEIGD